MEHNIKYIYIFILLINWYLNNINDRNLFKLDC
jgi:hypothetical protein